jgi:hypothetical protein
VAIGGGLRRVIVDRVAQRRRHRLDQARIGALHGVDRRDILVARSLLHILGRDEPAARADLAHAATIDPTNTRIAMIAHALGPPITKDAAAKLVAAQPDDWHAWWLAEAAGDPTAHARACASTANNPSVFVGACP